MSICRVIASTVVGLLLSYTVTAGVYLYVSDASSTVTLSAPGILLLGPGYEPPRSIRLTYNDRFGERGYQIDGVEGDTSVAAALMKHIEIKSGLRRPSVTLRRISQRDAFLLERDQVLPPNALMVVTSEVCNWETTANDSSALDDLVYLRANDSYGFQFGVVPIRDTTLVDVFPTFDVHLLRSLVRFPVFARRNNIEGQVMVDVLIAEDGTAYAAFVSKTDHQFFNQSAIHAILLTEYTPALKDGKPVPFWIQIPIAFKLQ